MMVNNHWSQLPLRCHKKERTFETSKGFLIVTITDETDDKQFDVFKALMLEHAWEFDMCQTQNEVFRKEKLLRTLMKQANIQDS